MNNQTMLNRTIRLQRTAWQNSLAILSAVQQHGEKFLKTTLQQNPWIPGSSKKTCLFLADLWTANMAGMTNLVDQNLADMERLSSPAKQKSAKDTAQKMASARPRERPKPSNSGTKQPSKKRSASPTPQTISKEQEQPKPAVKNPPQPVTGKTIVVKADPAKAAGAVTLPAKLSVLAGGPSERKE
jgi:hypothetical protein